MSKDVLFVVGSKECPATHKNLILSVNCGFTATAAKCNVLKQFFPKLSLEQLSNFGSTFRHRTDPPGSVPTFSGASLFTFTHLISGGFSLSSAYVACVM